MTGSPQPAGHPHGSVPFRIGIVGGMGPMAGVYLQQLIVELTPAERDQDHLEVVCFTNPHVPERMRSLAEDGGRRYAEAVRASAALVARAGATCIAIPCNTAHARLREIQAGIEVPVLDMIALGLDALVAAHGEGRRVGLLATIGTLNERVYEGRAGGRVAAWLLPEPADQQRVADAIRAVKVGRLADVPPVLRPVLARLSGRGAEVVIVGCTEISMCHDALALEGVPLIDPLRALAKHLVELGTRGEGPGARGHGLLEASMGATIYVNGRITGEGEAVVPVLDHGFLFGEGVYEVMRTYGRKPFLYGRHMDRLRRSAAMIDLAVFFTDEYLLGEIRKTADRFYEDQGAAGDGMEMYVRVLLTRGVGAITYDVRSCPAPTVVIIVKPQVDPSAEAYAQGVRVILVPVVRNHPGSINPLIKSNNLLNNALAWQQAKRQEGFEAIMRNYRGEISECSQSNLFVVKDGRASTPPLEAGLLAGITRAFVLECAASVNVPTRETTLHDEDLFGADEVFLTSTTREIVPIVEIDDRKVGTGVPGPVTETLLAEFRRRIPEGL